MRALVSTGAALLHTRLALAGVELEEEVQRLLSAAVLGVVAMVFALLAMVVGTFTIVAAVSPEHRVAVMVGITAVYLLVALGAILRVRSIFSNRPPIFAATLAELDKDKETLTQMNRAYHAAEDARDRARETHEDAFAPIRAKGETFAGSP